jgi:hypothetical protein
MSNTESGAQIGAENQDEQYIAEEESDGGVAVEEQDMIAAPSGAELRSSPRKQFQYAQRIAPMHGGLLPAKDEYFNVECNDISQGGISFYLRRPPGCEHFAVALGQKPKVTVLVAKVVYSRAVEHKGAKMILVGCKFVDRLHQ